MNCTVNLSHHSITWHLPRYHRAVHAAQTLDCFAVIVDVLSKPVLSQWSSRHHAPAPWALKASEAWWFMTSFMHKPKQGDTLPISYFGSHETNLHQISTEDGASPGGMGAIALIRYTETPVGPYDELAIIPGEFANPFGPPLPRCTRIYVSSLASVYNGRRNWNVPNELALFSFLPSFDVEDAIEVRVFAAISYSPVTYSETPFFAALIKPVTWPFPAIPLSLKRLPGSSTLLQPPSILPLIRH
ncbi:hypothetical protein A0H81_05838 [Grifola frondosa]|uniref:Uncharacterized protein n=1 Tax=Grifola frondosa TaxID=5627 RepID=A0A1C7M9J5_GRIFR|nr:hypothetical protein A0H81_05838 [Grifola frondosa]